MIDRVTGENAASRSARVYVLLGEAARLAEASDKSWDCFEKAIEASKGNRNQYVNIYKAFPPNETGVEWASLWYSAMNANQRRPVRELFDRIRTAYDGTMPLDDLTDAVTSVDFARPGNLPYIELMWEAARRTRTGGDEKKAEQQVEAAALRAPNGDLEMHLGDWAAERRDWTRAAAKYEAAWNKDRARALPLYLFGWALEQGGQMADGRQRMALAHLLPVGDETRRHDLIYGLYVRGLNDAAVREADMIIRIGHPMSRYAGIAFRLVAEHAEEKGDFALAAAVWQRFMGEAMANSNPYETHAMFINTPNVGRRFEARAKLAAGDIEGAKKIIDGCLQLVPTDGEVVLDLVLDYDKAGRRADGDELFNRGFALVDARCQKFPESGYELNEAAWVAAKCHRELDKALDYSTRAVKLQPKNAAGIDTLAEVYFQRGDTAKAVELEKQCVELSPLSPIHRQQLARFLAGEKVKVDQQ